MKHELEHKWNWYDLQCNGESNMNESLSHLPECREWLQHVRECETNFIHIDVDTKDGSILKGSLIYHQDAKEQANYKIFHFYMVPHTLITAGLDTKYLNRTTNERLISQLNQVQTAPEGFCIFLGEILNHFLDGIDDLEDTLKKLQRDVQDNNRSYLINKIYDSRIELINWSDLTMPVDETRLAAAEAFMEELTETKAYKRISIRMERTLSLIGNYRQDIDTLLRLEEVLSSHRGNEIMKTLTVFTVIFTPAMGFGSIWGMNFKYMPELLWKYGYLYSMILIGLSTIGVYLWLRMKGWTGDLLKRKKKKSHLG